YRIIDRIGVVPGPEQPAALRADIAALQQSVARMQASIDETLGAVAEESKSADRQYARLNEQYAALQSVVDGPAARLDRFMASTAVFFGNGDEFLDSGEAERQIQQLAELLANNDLRVRIVGYTD